MTIAVTTKANVQALSDYKDYERYGVEQAGKALAQFLTHVDTVMSNIGEYRPAYKPGEPELIVTGLQLEHVDSPIHMLSNLNVSLEVNSKFTSFMDKPPIQIIKLYLGTLGADQQEYKQALMDKFKGIVSNKYMIIPFKPSIDCELTIEDGVTTHRDVATKISSVMWSMSKETGKFQAKVIARLENVGKASKTYRIPIEEYGTSFKMASIERCMKTSDIDRATVSMTRFGIIKPTVISDGNISIAIDCVHLYLLMNNEVIIIGKWEDNGELRETPIATSLGKHKAYKHLKHNLNYIEKHRRFIAPYGLLEASEVQLNIKVEKKKDK